MQRKGMESPLQGVCVPSFVKQEQFSCWSLLLSGSELKIDFPKKAPFRWSYQGNLHYHLPASRLIWNSPAFDMLHFFSGAAAFSQQTPRRYSPQWSQILRLEIRMEVRVGLGQFRCHVNSSWILCTGLSDSSAHFLSYVKVKNICPRDHAPLPFY